MQLSLLIDRSRSMPIFYFDVTDGGPKRDVVGTECADDDEMRSMTRRLLPEIALSESAAEQDRAFFTVVVRDSEDRAVHMAALSYVEVQLQRRPGIPANILHQEW